MATFKQYINIEQADYANIPTDKIDLRKFSEASLSAAPGISNIIPSLIGNGNSFIDKQYMMISFTLARNDAETLALKYNTPRLYLSIRGTDYEGASKIINIYSNKDNNGDRFALRWDGNFGIGRVKVNVSDMIDFNTILEIGICIVRENETSEMIGRFFCFGDTVHNTSFEVNGQGDFDSTTVSELCQINKYTSTYSGSDFTGYVQISPQSITPEIEIKGTSNSNRTYKNTKYYYDEIFCPQNYTSFFNATRTATTIALYDANDNPTYISVSSDGFYIDKDTFSNEKVYYVYGGYQYKVTIKNTLKDFASFNNTDNPNWKEEFFNFFSFQGERYRTKFNGFSFLNNIQKVKLNTTKVLGILNSIQDSDCPYTTYGDFFLLSVSVISRPELVEISYNETGGPLSELSYYYTKTISLVNLFTSERKEIEINIPLEDEYQYYLLGEDIQLSNNANSNQKVSVLDEQEFVWYADANLNVVVNNAYLYDVANNEFIEVINDEKDENKNEIWMRYESRVPLDNPPKEVHIFKEEELSDKDKSLFQYWFWQYMLDGKDVTEKVKRLENFPYYTVIRCLDNSSDRVSFKDNKVIFKDGQLIYQFEQGFGDENSSFSHLDFLRYAIDKNKSIRLSQKFRGRTERLTIQGIKIIKVNQEEKEELVPIGYIESNSSDYRELLQFFYTGFQQSLALSQLTFFEGVNISTLLPEIKKLELIYSIDYGNNNSQIIFEKKVNVEIIQGIRPLGLRRNGIIINPVDVSEDLPDKTFGKINAFIDPVPDYTYIDDNKNERQRYDRANFLNMKVYDKSGNPVTDRQNNIAENTIYYGQDEEGNSGWYFDGVDVGDLYSKTLGDEDDSLKKNIENNTTNISNLKNRIRIAKTNLISKTNSNHNNKVTVGKDGLTTYDGSFTISNEEITNKLILSCQLSVYKNPDVSGTTTGTFADFQADIGTPYITSISYDTNNNITINYIGQTRTRSAIANAVSFSVQLHVLTLNLNEL